MVNRKRMFNAAAYEQLITDRDGYLVCLPRDIVRYVLAPYVLSTAWQISNWKAAYQKGRYQYHSSVPSTTAIVDQSDQLWLRDYRGYSNLQTGQSHPVSQILTFDRAQRPILERNCREVVRLEADGSQTILAVVKYVCTDQGQLRPRGRRGLVATYYNTVDNEYYTPHYPANDCQLLFIRAGNRLRIFDSRDRSLIATWLIQPLQISNRNGALLMTFNQGLLIFSAATIRQLAQTSLTWHSKNLTHCADYYQEREAVRVGGPMPVGLWRHHQYQPTFFHPHWLLAEGHLYHWENEEKNLN